MNMRLIHTSDFMRSLSFCGGHDSRGRMSKPIYEKRITSEALFWHNRLYTSSLWFCAFILILYSYGFAVAPFRLSLTLSLSISIWLQVKETRTTWACVTAQGNHFAKATWIVAFFIWSPFTEHNHAWVPYFSNFSPKSAHFPGRLSWSSIYI